MNSALLDRINQNGALRRIAACGGLVATQQFERFLDIHPRTARRAYQTMVQAKIARLIRTNQRARFVLLTPRTVEALGADLPRPPQPSLVRGDTCQLAVARIEYCLQEGAPPHSTQDLASRRLLGRRTRARLARAIRTQQAAIAHQLNKLEGSGRADDAARLRRHQRDEGEILQAGMAALNNRRGLYLLDPPNHAIRFVFVDRATQVRAYDRLLAMCQKFALATGLITHLDILCGSAHSHQRVEEHLQQQRLRLKLRVLNLNYDRFLGVSFGMPSLVEPRLIDQMLEGGVSS